MSVIVALMVNDYDLRGPRGVRATKDSVVRELNQAIRMFESNGNRHHPLRLTVLSRVAKGVSSHFYQSNGSRALRYCEVNFAAGVLWYISTSRLSLMIRRTATKITAISDDVVLSVNSFELRVDSFVMYNCINKGVFPLRHEGRTLHCYVNRVFSTEVTSNGSNQASRGLYAHTCLS